MAFGYWKLSLERSVHYNGYFRFNGQLYYLTDLLHKQSAALKEFTDGQWKIYYSFLPIGVLDLRKNKIIKLDETWLKCNPCLRFKM
jgi:hypothetical protein